MLADIRQALRATSRSPGFTALVLLVLAVGIGGTSTIFSVVYGVLLKPLPYPDASRLITVTNIVGGEGEDGVSYPDLQDWREQVKTVTNLVAFTSGKAPLTGRGNAVALQAISTTSDLFRLVHTEPVLGRTLMAADHEKGAAAVAVISESAWARLFARRPTVIGESITLAGKPRTIVGVMPAAFQFPVQPLTIDVWTPIEAEEIVAPFIAQRGAHFLSVVGRLAPGATLDQANAELTAVARRLAVTYPQSNANRTARAFPLHERLVTEFRLALLVLLAAVSAVLLIACGNVANLLLVRGTARQREMAIRAAMGASRSQLARQLLVESVLLSSAAGVLGVVFAQAGLSALVGAIPFDMPRLHEVAIDRGVLIFVTALSVTTGIVFAVVPALLLSRTTSGDALKDAAHTTTGARSARTRQGLIVAEVAVSLMLLASAGLLLRSLTRLQHVDPGFAPEHVVATGTIPLLGASVGDSDTAAQIAFARRVREEVSRSPNVSTAAVTTTLPLSGDDLNLTFEFEALPETHGRRLDASAFAVSPGYFETMGIRLVSGRTFTERDDEKAPNVIIISETMARRYWPAGNAIGKRMSIGYNSQLAREVIGVVADVKNITLSETAKPAVYTPFAQTPWQFLSVVMRTTGDVAGAASSIRKAVARVDPNEPVGDVKLLTTYVARTTASPRFLTMLVGSFAGFALLLAGCGVFSVMAYFVLQRRREIGIRMALGARTRDVRGLVLGQVARLGIVGLVIGVAGALAVARTFQALLFGIAPSDPITFALVLVIFGGVLMLAAYIPARRATRLDPAIALRTE